MRCSAAGGADHFRCANESTAILTRFCACGAALARYSSTGHDHRSATVSALRGTGDSPMVGCVQLLLVPRPVRTVLLEGEVACVGTRVDRGGRGVRPVRTPLRPP